MCYSLVSVAAAPSQPATSHQPPATSHQSASGRPAGRCDVWPAVSRGSKTASSMAAGSAEEAARLFAAADSDGSGELSFPEFARLVQREAWVYELTDQELQLGWMRMDADGSGAIGLDEFTAWWGGGVGQRFNKLRLHPEERQQHEWAARAFRRADKDGSGTMYAAFQPALCLLLSNHMLTRCCSNQRCFGVCRVILGAERAPQFAAKTIARRWGDHSCRA